MPLYHIVFVLLIAGAVWEHLQKKTPRRLFLFAFILLTAMLCLRFGQGQDYFNYANIYWSLPANPVEAIRNQEIHTEPGWKILCCLFRSMKAPFPVLVFVISAYMMLLFYRFLRIYGGERKLLALVLCYHTMYMSYFAGALRQGIVIATFLGLLLPWVLERKYIRYCAVVLLLSTLHSVSLMLLVLPLLQGVKLNFKQTVCLTAIGLLLGIVFTAMDLGSILNQIKVHMYFYEAEISLIAILERIATFAVVTLCVYIYSDGFEPAEKDPVFVIYHFYAMGLFLYGLLMWSALISSRAAFLFKMVEIILICACIVKCKKTGAVVLCYCLMLSSVLYVKNIDSYLDQGQYQNATVASYPYVSVFNQRDILNYRQDAKGYPFESIQE